MTLFSEDIYSRKLERLMTTVPNFKPRGIGFRFAEPQIFFAVTATPAEILSATVQQIRCPPFRKRFNEYIESEENPMTYINEKHRTRFTLVAKNVRRENYALLATLYLLTADGRLWNCCKHHIAGNTVFFEKIKLYDCSERAYTLYDLWYESKETALKVYTESRPERLPLSQNKEFKSVKNMVIAEAMKLNLPADAIEEPEPTEPDDEPSDEEIESADVPQEDADPPNKWQLYRMAKEHLDRDGDSYDPRKAVEYLTQSAKQGYTVAKYMLGKLYLKGEDVPKQMLHALHWLESAVQDDNQYAEYLLGKTFLKGEDIERDIERAESLLRRSAEQENKYAAYTLGKAYLDGDILVQSIDEAVRLLNLSASKNFAPAQFILGRLLYKGEVVPKDIRQAVRWLDRAAAQKNPYAAYLAGKVYLTEESVKDIVRAVRSFEIAAENGNDYAEYQLGKIYLYGNGVPRDYDSAMYYLHLAADHGNNYAAQLLHSIKVNGNWTAALASLRLLGHMARVIQNRLEDECKGRKNSIDHKLRRKIEEKKQAHGLKQ